MNYELFFSASENSYELSPADPPAVTIALRAADAVLVQSFDADSMEEAIHRKNVFLGWAVDPPRIP